MATQVLFDGIPATGVNRAGGTITGTTPPHAEGWSEVTVITDNCTYVFGYGFYFFEPSMAPSTYIPPPSLWPETPDVPEDPPDFSPVNITPLANLEYIRMMVGNTGMVLWQGDGWFREARVSPLDFLVVDRDRGVVDYDLDKVALPYEAEWVVIEDENNIRLSETGEYGLVVYAAKRRIDVTGSVGVTLLEGPYTIEIASYDPDILTTCSFGDELMIRNDGTTSFLSKLDSNPSLGYVPVGIYVGMTTRNGVVYIVVRYS